MKPQSKEALVGAATLLALSGVLLLPYLTGHWRLADDAYLFHLPFMSLQERILASGQWPLWNLNVGLGQPWGLYSGASIFYPVQALWGLLVGWSEKSYLCFLLAHFFAGGLLAARFGRMAGLSSHASLFFAMAFVGNGYVLGLLSNPSLIIPYLLWPLLATGLLGLHGKKKDLSRATIETGLALIAIETSGYPLTKLLIIGVTAAAYLFYSRKAGIAWEPLLLAGGAALLATAPDWITQFQALKLSDRMASNIYGDVTYGSPTNFMAVGSALIPGAFLKRDGFQLGMVWLERSWWIGTLTIGLVLAGLQQGIFRQARLRVPAVLALLCFLFSMGGHSFVRELSSAAFPLLEHLRFANNARLVPMALLAFLGALAFASFEKSSPNGSRETKSPWVARSWGLFLLACALSGFSELDSQRRSAELYLDASSGWKIASLHSLFYALLAYTAYAQGWTLGTKRKWPAVLLAIQFLNLGDTAYAFRRLVAYESATGLKTTEEFRIAGPQPNQRSLKAWFDTDDWVSWGGNKKVLNAYSQPQHARLRLAKEDDRIKPLLGSLASCQDRPQELIGTDLPGGPRSCAGVSFRIDRFFGNEIEITGSGPAPALIAIHDLWDPYWTASVNGAPAVVHKAFTHLKAVEVPAGQEWKLRLAYRHPLFPALWLISFSGFLLLAFSRRLLGRAN